MTLHVHDEYAGGGSHSTGNGNGGSSRNEHRPVIATDLIEPERLSAVPLQVEYREFAPVLETLPGQLQAGVRQRFQGLTLTVVIPTLNEAENIERVLNELRPFDDIVLVDGMSTDGTVELARSVRPDVRVLQRPPRGKGDALRAGFAAATGDVIVIMDADGSMDAGEVQVFMATIALGFDLVKGSRMACGGGSHDLTTIRLLGNAALCRLANTLFHTHWTDLCYGYLAFRRVCLPRMALTANGFEIESQILGSAAIAGMRIAEVPSVEMPRFAGESHLNARRDGTRIVKTMLAARFAPRARRSAASLRPVAMHD